MNHTRPTRKDAYQLFHKGALALARMEANGIKIDMPYLEQTEKETDGKIATLTRQLREDKVYSEWRKRYGIKANLNSREQLGEVIFGCLKYQGRNQTATGRHKTEEEDFKNVNLPFVKTYFQVQRLQKLRGTYLKGIRDEVVDGLVHPVLNLNLAASYRSSCSDPNLQNIPARQPEIARTIRRCFIPRKGRRIVEIDFSGVEVRVAACVTKDPVLIKYIKDPTTDMHRDMAAELFLLSPEQVEKKTTRDWTKNRFVFPNFYGSVWFQCGPHLWEGVESGAKLADGTTVRDHLRSKGIRKGCSCRVKKDKGKEIHEDPQPGTFCYHVRDVEKAFWEMRFKAYNQWKKDWWAEYQKKGYMDIATGFRGVGVYKRNEALNFPIQGPAFHCLLYSTILIQRELDRRKMRTLLINEVHDSLMADCPEDEIQEFISLAFDIMTEEVPKRWKSWIIVPISAEVDVTPLERSWADKVPWAAKDGIWSLAG